MTRIAEFRARLRASERLIGTFRKTPWPVLHEVLALSPLDCVCIDAERTPFDRTELGTCVAALRAGNMPSLIRVAQNAPHEVLAALDLGATGVVVSHVATASAANAAVAAANSARHSSRRVRSSSACWMGRGSSRQSDSSVQPRRAEQLEAGLDHRPDRLTSPIRIEHAEATELAKHFRQCLQLLQAASPRGQSGGRRTPRRAPMA